MKPLLLFVLALALSGCASFQHPDGAIFIGTPEDIKYDPSPEMPCGDGHTCIEMQPAVERFYEVDVMEEKDGWVRFTRHSAYHSRQYGWIKKTTLAYPEDFQPVRHWTGETHWNICDQFGCTVVDIDPNGSFKATYTDSCSTTDYRGKCSRYCPFTEKYDSVSCKDWGQLTRFNDTYQLQYRSGAESYLATVEGKGLCWFDFIGEGTQCSPIPPKL